MNHENDQRISLKSSIIVPAPVDLDNLSIGQLSLTNASTFSGTVTATDIYLTLMVNGSSFNISLYKS